MRQASTSIEIRHGFDSGDVTQNPPCGAVRVYFIDLRFAALDPVAVLSRDEIERLNRFRDPLVQQRWARTRVATRCIVGHHTGLAPAAVAFLIRPFGKPEIDGQHGPGAWRFSVSHSGEWACIAIGRSGAIGVDLEIVKATPFLADVSALVLSERERRWLDARAEPETMFLRLWSRKEAVLKASGVGLNDDFPMNRIDVLDDVVCAPIDENCAPLGRWRLSMLDAPLRAIAVLATAADPPFEADLEAARPDQVG